MRLRNSNVTSLSKYTVIAIETPVLRYGSQEKLAVSFGSINIYASHCTLWLEEGRKDGLGSWWERRKGGGGGGGVECRKGNRVR